MKQAENASQKIEKELNFAVQLNWLEKSKGVLSADDVDNSLIVATPSAFGGEGHDWSPEHMFLGSISSCYMSTFMVFAKKLQMVVEKLECETTGVVAFVNGSYQFTNIEVYPRICVNQKWEEKANIAMNKTQNHCLISHSIKCPVEYYGKVIFI